MGALQAIADIILILAALISLIAFAFLGYAAWIIIGLVKEVKSEVALLTQTARETLGDVQNTTRFVGGSVVRPAAQAAGFVSGARATVKALTEDVMKKSRSA